MLFIILNFSKILCRNIKKNSTVFAEMEHSRTSFSGSMHVLICMCVCMHVCVNCLRQIQLALIAKKCFKYF